MELKQLFIKRIGIILSTGFLISCGVDEPTSRLNEKELNPFLCDIFKNAVSPKNGDLWKELVDGLKQNINTFTIDDMKVDIFGFKILDMNIKVSKLNEVSDNIYDGLTFSEQKCEGVIKDVKIRPRADTYMLASLGSFLDQRYKFYFEADHPVTTDIQLEAFEGEGEDSMIDFKLAVKNLNVQSSNISLDRCEKQWFWRHWSSWKCPVINWVSNWNVVKNRVNSEIQNKATEMFDRQRCSIKDIDGQIKIVCDGLFKFEKTIDF